MKRQNRKICHLTFAYLRKTYAERIRLRLLAKNMQTRGGGGRRGRARGGREGTTGRRGRGRPPIQAQPLRGQQTITAFLWK
jgi:hypothetical protein